MAGLATATTVSLYTALPATKLDTLINAHLATAEKRVRDRIGDTIYTAIAAAAGAPYTAAVKTAVQRAESLICGALVLRNFLHQAGPTGMVVSVLSPDGTESKLASQNQLDGKAAGWEAEAWETLGQWETLYQESLRDAGDERVLPAGTFRAGRLHLTALSGRGASDA